jgi:hypothetical protein
MDTTAPRSALGRRLMRGTAAVVATVALGLGLSAGTAAAEPKGGGGADCGPFHANMDDALSWIRAADRLEAAGDGAVADKASAKAEHSLEEAEGALGGTTGAC